ncbi:hypothetical protein D1BOALGB6SA_2637 [Olavius sp. associated proteobacterium Delta 1]|nr:hypothetical protein D1BOALGB6SA_2637 [Olavius sp. associated proteobacterium Delta 1]
MENYHGFYHPKIIYLLTVAQGTRRKAQGKITLITRIGYFIADEKFSPN